MDFQNKYSLESKPRSEILRIVLIFGVFRVDLNEQFVLLFFGILGSMQLTRYLTSKS